MSLAVKIEGISLRLTLSFRERTFTGHSVYQLADVEEKIALESEGLDIEGASVDGVPAPFVVDRPHSTVTIPGVAQGTHRLEIRYRGAASAESLVGLYVSPTGSSHCLTSMMFPTGARRLVPCLEHPSVKTVYHLTLVTEPESVVVFNTAPRSERVADGHREITFDPTPPMSSYLLYLAVGHFDTLAVHGPKWAITVLTSPGRAVSGRYAADRASEILAEYEQYYGVPYPLSKLDLVGLENFWAGAMENWGAIAFRETLLLVDPSSSVLDRRDVLRVLAHEIAHQWFGNLVTPAEWSDFWLNESFATFVGFRSSARLYPEDDPWCTFMMQNARIALREDSLESTHAIQIPVRGADELNAITDEITYGKGACVLRMMETYLGEEAFRRGVSLYLDRHKYGNARASDLWKALAETSGRPVERIMGEWITRPGYPLVRARWSGNKLELRQERFRLNGKTTPEVWPLPLTVRSGSAELSALLEGTTVAVPLEGPANLTVNPGRTAFARVFYEGALADQLVSEFPGLPPIDQWSLIDDTSAFVVAGLSPLDQLLDLVQAATEVHGELPVRAVTQALTEFYLPLYDHPKFLETAQGFLRSQLAFIGRDPAPGEDDSARALRELLTARLVLVDAEFAREIAPRFPELDRQPPELRGSILQAFARTEGARAFDPMIALLRATDSDNVRALVLQGLSHLQDPPVLRRALDLIPSPGVTPSGSMELLMGLGSSPVAGVTLFDWYRERSEDLSKLWAGTPLLGVFLRRNAVTMGLDRVEALKSYLAAHTPRSAERSAREGQLLLEALQGLRDRNRSGSPPAPLPRESPP